jgi:hypothetical protein
LPNVCAMFCFFARRTLRSGLACSLPPVKA